MASFHIRRRLCTSSASFSDPTTSTLQLDITANPQLLELLESVSTDTHTHTSADASGPVVQATMRDVDQDLNRMLSLHSKILTTSSAAERYSIADAEAEGSESFRKIGAGACGAVFAQDGKSLVIKLAKTTEQDHLWNDYVMHSLIAKHFRAYKIDKVNVPSCYFFVPKDDPHYFRQHPGLVEAAAQVCNLPTSALVTERILPHPHATRARLIEKYCSPKNKDKALSDPANKDCLVRVYLGSSQGKSGAMFFSLRNFKMHLNQMVDIQLDVEAMARRMAIAMAIMHWAAQTDARDVEFVLGSSTYKTPLAMDIEDVRKLEPFTYTGPQSRRDEDFFHRTTELWVLDFNQVRKIILDEAGVAQAVDAVCHNDPYLPKPLQESQIGKKVWNVFVMAYLEASSIILKKDHEQDEHLLRLPMKFLEGLIDAEREKKKKRAEMA